MVYQVIGIAAIQLLKSIITASLIIQTSSIGNAEAVRANTMLDLIIGLVVEIIWIQARGAQALFLQESLSKKKRSSERQWKALLFKLKKDRVTNGSH
jgi:hypothetical protein